MSKPRPLIPVATTKNSRIVPHYVGMYDEGDLPSHYCGGKYNDGNCPTEWVPTENAEWTGDLEVIGYHGGRSSSCYEVRIHTNDGKLPIEGMMSCSSFVRLIVRVVNGRVSGTWCARKKGSNYMIQERA